MSKENTADNTPSLEKAVANFVQKAPSLPRATEASQASEISSTGTQPSEQPKDGETPAEEPQQDVDAATPDDAPAVATDQEPEEDAEEPTETEAEISPEDQALIDEAVVNIDEKDRVLETLQLWSETVEPNTLQWFMNQAEARKERLSKAESDSNLANARTDLTEEQKQALEDQSRLKPVSFDKASMWQSFKAKQIESGEVKDSEYITESNFKRRFGLDPNAVPEQFANIISELISDHNKNVSDRNFLNREAKKAFQKRDEARTNQLRLEYSNALKESGYEVNEDAMLLFDKARKALHLNGKKQPWTSVIKDISSKHKGLIRRAEKEVAAQNHRAAETGNETPSENVTESSKKTSVGTRLAESTAPTSKKTTPVTLESAQQSFIARMKAMQNKG